MAHRNFYYPHYIVLFARCGLVRAYSLVLNFGTKARFGHLFSTYFLRFSAYIYGIAAHDIMLYCAPNA
jgi:hypothetical protein